MLYGLLSDNLPKSVEALRRACNTAAIDNYQCDPSILGKMQAPGLISHGEVFAAQGPSYFWWLHLPSDDLHLELKLKDIMFSNPSFPCKIFKL